MNSNSIEKGDILLFTDENTRYRVLYVSPVKYVVLFNMDSSKLGIQKEELKEIEEGIKQGKITHEKNNFVVDVNKLSKSSHRKLEKYRPIIEDFDAIYGPTYLSLIGRQRKPKLHEIMKKHNISKNSLWYIIKKYLRCGCDLLRLSILIQPKTQREREYTKKPGVKSNAGIPLTNEVREHLDYALEKYKSGRIPNMKNAQDAMNLEYYSQAKIIENGSEVNLVPAENRPTYNQVRYYINKKLRRSEIDVLKTSASEQRNDKRVLLGAATDDTDDPCDLAEIDAVELDVILVSDINPDFAIGRPIAYMLIDVYSRMILAISVAFDNNSYIGVSSCFMNLCDDKVEFCKRYGVDITPDMWPSNYIPRRIRCDRGSEFNGLLYRMLLSNCDIQRDRSPARIGSMKPIIEQTFKQLHNAQNIYLENNGLIEKREDSNHYKESTLTLPQYMKMIINFVIYYNTRYMPDYNLPVDMVRENVLATPHNIWKYGVENRGEPRKIDNKNLFLFNIMIPDSGSISKFGIQFRTLIYTVTNDPILKEDMYRAGTKRVPFELRYDPRCVNYIYYVRDMKLYHVGLSESDQYHQFINWTFSEWDCYRKILKKAQKNGEAYNEQVRATLMYNNQRVIASSAKDLYSSTKNVILNRRMEKNHAQFGNRIETRLDLTEDASQETQDSPNAQAVGNSSEGGSNLPDSEQQSKETKDATTEQTEKRTIDSIKRDLEKFFNDQ